MKRNMRMIIPNYLWNSTYNIKNYQSTILIILKTWSSECKKIQRLKALSGLYTVTCKLCKKSLELHPSKNFNHHKTIVLWCTLFPEPKLTFFLAIYPTRRMWMHKEVTANTLNGCLRMGEQLNIEKLNQIIIICWVMCVLSDTTD